jgi:hypothetical protein
MDMSVLNDLAMISDVATTSSEEDDGLDAALESVAQNDAPTTTITRTETNDDELGDFLWGDLAGLDSTVHDLDDLCRD